MFHFRGWVGCKHLTEPAFMSQDESVKFYILNKMKHLGVPVSLLVHLVNNRDATKG